jgi:hypothetical protein
MTRCLFVLLASLCLVHCGSDANGGEGDGAEDPSVEPDAAGDVETEDLHEDVGEEDPGEDVLDAQEEHPAETAADRVLFIGNSYTSVNQLHELVSDLLVEAGYGGHTEAVAPGGYRLDEHADDADGTNGDTRLRELLVTGEEAHWDAVVLQQQSQVPGFPHTEPYWIAMVEGATTLRDLASDAGADTVLFMTWGYRDGDDLNPGLYPDYPTMQDRISDGYTSLADLLDASGDPVFIAPAGEAWRSIHDSGDTTAFEGLYAPDGSHPSIRGSYLTACVIFATLTDESPVGLSGPAEIDAAGRLELQERAEAVVLDASAPERWTR